MTMSSGSCPVSWSLRGSSFIARSWAATTPSTCPPTIETTLLYARNVGCRLSQ